MDQVLYGNYAPDVPWVVEASPLSNHLLHHSTPVMANTNQEPARQVVGKDGGYNTIPVKMVMFVHSPSKRFMITPHGLHAIGKEVWVCHEATTQLKHRDIVY